MTEPLIREDDLVASVIVPSAGTTTVSGGGGGGALVEGGTLPAAAIKFADLTESGSESGDDAAIEPGTSTSTSENNGRASPPPKCAICLSRCKRKCFTDSCLHQFCFKCLCEWSKIKPECPLCKQAFKTIIHNVRTLDDYDRYPVQANSSPPLPEPALRFHILNIRRPRFMPLVQNQGVMTHEIDASAESEDGIPTVDPSRILPPTNRFEPYRTELMHFYRHDNDAGPMSFNSLSQLWRRYVYDRKLYALPVRDSLTGHFREWSARFYRDNPAQMHRLMPWINRDIVCLMRNSAYNVSNVMHLMHAILPMTNILGPTFRRRLTPYLGERTSHFIHELFNFARSPYDMIGYDRVVQYSSRVAEEVEVDLDMVSPQSSNEDDVEGAAVAADMHNNAPDLTSNDWQQQQQQQQQQPPQQQQQSSSSNSRNSSNTRPSTSVIVTNPSATHSFSVTMATDGSELPGISIRATTSNVGSQTVAINLSMRRPAGEVIEIDDGDAAANAEVAAINDSSSGSPIRRHAGASLPVSAHIELQSSDSACSNNSDDDECVFVLERKPPHLRTPELVSLDSASDSDVVFVDEQKPANVATQPKTDGVGTQHLNSATVSAAAAAAAAMSSELFMGPSTSTGVCSTSGKNWKKVLEEARRQDRMCLRNNKRTSRRRTSRRSNATAAAAAAAAAAVTASYSFGRTTSSSSSGTSEFSSWLTSSSTSSDSDSNTTASSQRKKRIVRKSQTRKRAAVQQRSSKSSKRKRTRHSKPTYSHSHNVQQHPQQHETNGDGGGGDEEEDEEENEVREEEQEQAQATLPVAVPTLPESSSDETSSSSCADGNNNNNHNSDDDGEGGSSSSSSNDSTENIRLSALRATLKAEVELAAAATESSGDDNHKHRSSKHHLKVEPALHYATAGADNTREDEGECSAPKRRRTCSSSGYLEANITSLSSDASASSASFCTTSSSSSSAAASVSALSLFNTDANDANDPLVRGSAISPHLPTTETMDHLMMHTAIANSLIELSTAGQQQQQQQHQQLQQHQRQQQQQQQHGVSSDQTAGVEDAISFLRTALPNNNVHDDEDGDDDDDDDNDNNDNDNEDVASAVADVDIFSDTNSNVDHHLVHHYRMEPAIDVVGEEIGEDSELGRHVVAAEEDSDMDDGGVDDNDDDDELAQLEDSLAPHSTPPPPPLDMAPLSASPTDDNDYN